MVENIGRQNQLSSDQNPGWLVFCFCISDSTTQFYGDYKDPY